MSSLVLTSTFVLVGCKAQRIVQLVQMTRTKVGGQRQSQPQCLSPCLVTMAGGVEGEGDRKEVEERGKKEEERNRFNFREGPSLSQGGSFRRETAALREGTADGRVQSPPLPAAAVTRIPPGEQRHLGAIAGGEESVETGQTPEPLCKPFPTRLTTAPPPPLLPIIFSSPSNSLCCMLCASPSFLSHLPPSPLFLFSFSPFPPLPLLLLPLSSLFLLPAPFLNVPASYCIVSVPDPKPTPARIAFSITHKRVILEVIYAPDEVWGRDYSLHCVSHHQSLLNSTHR